MSWHDAWSESGGAAAVSGEPGAPGAVCRRGLDHLTRGELTDAEQVLREALRLKARCAPAAALLAWTLAGQGRIEDAERWAGKACAAASRRAWPLMLRACLRKTWNRGESACGDLEAALDRGAGKGARRLLDRWRMEMGLAPLSG